MAEFIDRGESARSADRPQLQAMLGLLKESKGIDYVIVHKVDRLARNREDDVYINLALRTAGAKLVSATENIDETPSGKLLHGIMATIAEFYSGNLANEVAKGMIQKAKSGGTVNRAAIGYRNTLEEVDGRTIKTVAIDPERAPLIQFAFETYASGEHSLAQVANMLAAKGLTPRPTKSFRGTEVYVSTLSKILQNPYYAGSVRCRGVVYEGRHIPIITPELFQRVQNMLKSRLAGEKQRRHLHYLKGTVFCARCSSRLCVTYAKEESLNLKTPPHLVPQ